MLVEVILSSPLEPTPPHHHTQTFQPLMVTYGHAWYGPLFSLMVLYGSIWPCMVSNGQIWFRIVPYGPVWSCAHAHLCIVCAPVCMHPYETCFGLFFFSLVQASNLSPRFGPKWNSNMPFDHHPPPTANF